MKGRSLILALTLSMNLCVKPTYTGLIHWTTEALCLIPHEPMIFCSLFYQGLNKQLLLYKERRQVNGTRSELTEQEINMSNQCSCVHFVNVYSFLFYFIFYQKFREITTNIYMYFICAIFFLQLKWVFWYGFDFAFEKNIAFSVFK